MSASEQERASRKTDTPEAETDDSSVTNLDERKTELDAILDDIDDILETNAEAFVQGFIQKGGQ